MAKSSARKTADAIHNIPEYYTGTTEPTVDQLKMGDMWFTSTTRLAKPKQVKTETKKRKPLKRITDLRPKVKQLRSKKNGN